MERFGGKVAFITGAARGQGRSHALRLASEGADIIAVDIAHQIDTVPYPMGTPEDLDETRRAVEALGRRVVARQADVRRTAELGEALQAGVSALGRLDVVCANAGIFTVGRIEELPDAAWDDVVDINLTGVWHTIKVSVPHLEAAGGGSIVITGSTSAARGFQNTTHYVAAKHGLVGLAKSAALELGPRGIRVNMVHPASVDNDMIHNEMNYELFAPDLPPQERIRETLTPRFAAVNALPTPWLTVSDISSAVAWLASDEARFVTGASVAVDAGAAIK